MIIFNEFQDAIEEAEFCAKKEKRTYGIRIIEECFEVYLVERRGTHNILEITGRRTSHG